jgi:hypothetical protein
MQSKAGTVAQYLEELPDDRRAPITKLRSLIRKHLPKGFAETMQYGMITWVVPHKLYPAGYHCKPTDALPFASLASQKNYMSLYLMSMYMGGKVQAYLEKQFAAAGLKLDAGKSCIRFKKLEDLPLDAIAAAVGMVSVEEWIKIYESKLKR